MLEPRVATARQSTAYLDGLRGLAALCVFNGHFLGGGDHEMAFGQLKEDGTRNWEPFSLPLLRLVYVGAPAAVSVFFVLSGFVVSRSLLARLADGKSITRAVGSAVVRRPVRLYLPCFFVALMVALAIHLPFDIYPSLLWLQPADGLRNEMRRLLVESLSMFSPFHPGVERFFMYDLVVWTIPIELKGSLICYFLVLIQAATGNQTYTTWLLAVVTGLLLQLGSWWQACFVAGYNLSLVDPSPGRDPLRSHAILLVSGLLLSVVQTAGHPEWAAEAPGYAWLNRFVPAMYPATEHYRYWTSIGAIGFLYAVLRISWMHRVLEMARPLGKVSFMLYLIHLPLACCFSDRFIRVFGYIGPRTEDRWWDHLLWLPELGIKGLNVRWIVAWSSILAVNLVVASQLTKWVDEPTVRLSKSLSKALGLDQVEKPVIVLPK